MISSTQSNTTQKRMTQKGKGRKFFQQMQPTFAIQVPPTAVKLEFLDENDPAKDTIVRKKAREWVNKNREISNQSRRRAAKSASAERSPPKPPVEEAETQIVRRKSEPTPTVPFDPMKIVGSPYTDPFNILPNIGREYGHVVQYFFSTACPEEIPCSDDKYASTPQNSLINFSNENTVLGNMAKSDLAFLLWLYATVTIRDGIVGSFDTEEIYWYYNKALKALQDALAKEMKSGEYTDGLLNALACITATASFSGMFSVAVLHRDALIRILTLRGNGDVLRGIYTAPQWTRKAIQWCEIMVATQLVEIPKVPYFHPYDADSLPDAVVAEAETLTAITCANLPPITESLVHIIRLLHQLGVCYAKKQDAGIKVDDHIIQPLYDAEFAILKLLSSHKETPFLSDIELLLAETFQLYFWTGPRALPPQTRLCDLLISRIIKALLVLVLEKVPNAREYNPVMARGFQPSHPDCIVTVNKTLLHPRQTNNAIVWSLALGTIACQALKRPEYLWLHGHYKLYVQAMGLDCNKADYEALLRLFPTTEGFSWIDLRSLYTAADTPNKAQT